MLFRSITSDAIISTDSAMASLVMGNAREGCSSTKLRSVLPCGIRRVLGTILSNWLSGTQTTLGLTSALSSLSRLRDIKDHVLQDFHFGTLPANRPAIIS